MHAIGKLTSLFAAVAALLSVERANAQSPIVQQPDHRSVSPVPPQPFAGQTLPQARNRLLDLWVKDRAFNRRMRRAPVQTLERMGVALTAEDRAFIGRMNWAASDVGVLRQAADPGPSDSG